VLKEEVNITLKPHSKNLNEEYFKKFSELELEESKIEEYKRKYRQLKRRAKE
jgi:hypothetical protein